MIIINNPFVLEINNKKIIAQLYKKILKRLTDEQKSMISNIEMSIFKLLDQLLTEDEITLTYSTELNFLDILSICKVEFRKINYENYLEMLVYYLKINNEYNHTSIIISNGLLNILTEEEIKLLEVELKLLGMNVIDISVNTKENKVKKIAHIIFLLGYIKPSKTGLLRIDDKEFSNLINDCIDIKEDKND